MTKEFIYKKSIEGHIKTLDNQINRSLAELAEKFPDTPLDVLELARQIRKPLLETERDWLQATLDLAEVFDNYPE